MPTINFNPFNDNSVYCYPGTWVQAHDGTAAKNLRGGTDNYSTAQFVTPDYSVERFFCTIDTSSLGASVIITSATFTIRAHTGVNDGTRSYNIYNSSHSDTVVATDFTTAGNTAWSNTSHVDTDFTNGSDVTWTLNSAGLLGINTTGKTKLCVREINFDVANTAPSNDRYSGIKNATSATPAVLTVTYKYHVSFRLNKLRPRIFAPGNAR